MPEELWTEIHGIVQEALTKIISKKKKCKKAKWLSEEALQIAEKKGKLKTKRKGKIYPFEYRFPKNRRRDKVFLSDQCKEIEENNRMGKTTDVFKKIRIPREHFMQRWAR